MDQIIPIGAALVVAYASHAIYRARFPKYVGPPGLPYFGNLFQLGKFPQLSLTEWSKKYGDVFTIRMGAAYWFVANTSETYRDILVNNTAISSSRTAHYVLGKILAFDSRTIVTLPYGDEWKMKRKMFATAFNKAAVKGYAPILENESARYATHLLERTEAAEGRGTETLPLTQCHTVNVLLGNIFGRRMDSFDNPECRELLHLLDSIFRMSSAERFSVDFMPFLRPFYRFYSSIMTIRDRRDQIISGMLEEMRERIHNPDVEVPDCMARKVVEAEEEGILSREDALAMLYSVFSAGTDTTACSINWCILLLSQHPEAQKKVQEEMDRIVGRDRLPTLADMDDLEYLRGAIKETVRMRSPGFLSIPHVIDEDTVYKGHVIKKGTWLMGNIWAMVFDDAVYEDSKSFKPERWAEKNRSLCADAMGPQDQRDIWIFGTGRRVCVGMHLAEAEFYLTIATTMWSFNIGTGDGEVVDIHAMDPGLTMHAMPNRLTFTPRDAGVRPMLAKAVGTVVVAE